MKSKAFFIIFEGSSLKQIIIFLEGESPTLRPLAIFAEEPHRGRLTGF